MSRLRQGYLLRGVAVFIVAVFSGAWTFSVAGIGGLSATTAEPAAPGGLPDGSSVPSQAINSPASLSDAATIEGAENGNTAKIVAASSTNAIPAAALAAYQRAETVINKADRSCNLTWQLVAAIGRVESNHGRSTGNALDNKGVAKPGIYGPALNGTSGVKAVSDTDAGQYDNDAKWDRAVGPMQFIPSTWSVVGVDADDDAARNPQDIDDSALAAAVFLCSGTDNLANLAGQKAAVFRYNHSRPYVDLVIKVMEQYLSGDYTSVTGTTTAGGYIVPDPSYTPPPAYNPPAGGRYGGTGGGGTGGGGGLDGGSTDGDGDGGGDDGDGGGDGDGDGDGGGTPGVTDNDTVKKTVEGAGKAVDDTVKGVQEVVSKATAELLCLTAADHNACMAKYGY